MQPPRAARTTSLLLTLALTLTLPGWAAQAPKFLTSEVLPAGAGLQEVVAGDFNHDGKIDLAVTNQPGLSVLLGNGDGTFQAPATYKVKGNSGGSSIAVGDMNNDGNLDLVVTTVDANPSVQIFLGNGDGTFQAPRVTTIAFDHPTSIAIADFNGDGNQDVVIGTWGNVVGVFLGNGKGDLQPEVTYPLIGGGHAGVIAVGDINNDGKLDLVVNDNHINFLLGNGNGTFQAATDLNTGAGDLALYDVNGDGYLDLVFTEGEGLGVLLNQGNGTFGKVINSPAGIGVMGSQFVMGDFNGDGKVDVAFSFGAIMLGRGDGTFAKPAVRYANFGGGLTAADVNGDKNLDVIGISGNVLVTLGNGNGSMDAARFYEGPGPWFQVQQMVLGDFTNDGKLDIAAFENPGDFTAFAGMLLGNGNGTFQPSLPSFEAYGEAATGGIAAGDFNHDGNLDLAVWNQVNEGTSQVAVYLGNGDGTFKSPIFADAGYLPVGMAVGDFNGDGKLDVAMLDTCLSQAYCSEGGVVTILLGNGDGTLTTGGTFGVGFSPNSIVAADFNNDGVLDLAVANFGSNFEGSISLLIGVGNGTFQPAHTVKSGTNPEYIQAADLNDDGKQDLVVVDSATISVDVMLGGGNGKFGAPILTPLASVGNFAIADFNGDGRLDVVVTNGEILSGKGNGTFAPPVNVYPNGISVQAAILGNDVLPDIIIGNYQGVAVLRNLGK
ncbi:MAG TPA: VCBS repeat-containing protein [Terriglobales bacterium]|nr:VCBS repeat-containing protein [Terriglobales bacterium]